MTKQLEYEELFSQENHRGKNTGTRYVRALLDQALAAADLSHEEKLARARQFLQAAISLNRPFHRLGKSAREIQAGARKLAKRYPHLPWQALEQTILLLSQEHHQSISLHQLRLGELAGLPVVSPEPPSPVLPGLWIKNGRPLKEFFSQLTGVSADSLSLAIPGRDGKTHPFESAGTLRFSFRYLDIFHLYPEPESYRFWVKVKNSKIKFPLVSVFDPAEPEAPLGSLTLAPTPELNSHQLSQFSQKPVEIISGATLETAWTGSRDFKLDRLTSLFKATLDC